MKKKIKLKDMTKEQWKRFKKNDCYNNIVECKNCPLKYINCSYSDKDKELWIYHKNLYSDKLLDYEIEIEEPDILSKAEKEYLSAVIKPFRDRVIFIKKVKCANNNYFISIKISSELSQSGEERIYFPFFQNDMYKRMESNKDYTLEDLDL